MSPQLLIRSQVHCILTTDIITEKNVLILSNLSIPLTDFSLTKKKHASTSYSTDCISILAKLSIKRTCHQGI